MLLTSKPVFGSHPTCPMCLWEKEKREHVRHDVFRKGAEYIESTWCFLYSNKKQTHKDPLAINCKANLCLSGKSKDICVYLFCRMALNGLVLPPPHLFFRCRSSSVQMCQTFISNFKTSETHSIALNATFDFLRGLPSMLALLKIHLIIPAVCLKNHIIKYNMCNFSKCCIIK